MIKHIFLMVLVLLMLSCGGKKQTDDMSNSYSPTAAKSEAKSMEDHPGKPLFEQYCGACHQMDGSGVPGMYPPLRESEFVNGEVKWLVTTLVKGRQGPITVKGETYDNLMPAVDYLSDEEIANILSYVRQSFGNNSDEVTVKEVKKYRDEAKGGM